MKPRERFQAILNGQMPDDRLPMVEWAAWWDKTIIRWLDEGLPADADFRQPGGMQRSLDLFGLDPLELIGTGPVGRDCPRPARHGAGILWDEAGYEAMLPRLYPEASIERLCERATALKARHDAGEISIRLWLDGFFWFPRTLFGIEAHLFAFYDYPELMLRMNEDLLAFHNRALDALLPILVPDLCGFAEDMSYNLGPMLSEEMFDEFLAPFYKALIPRIRASGMRMLVDSDGDVQPLLPWLIRCGVEGIYPLERQSMVDVAAIRARYPEFIMLGGYDKRVMSQGEAAIRAEFERLLPTMKSGRFIPSVDHQTPPEVSLEDYRIYARLFAEYARRAVTERPHDDPSKTSLDAL